MESPFKVLSLVANLLEQHQIKYVLVGSFASSIHGMYRATADAKKLGLANLLETATSEAEDELRDA